MPLKSKKPMTAEMAMIRLETLCSRAEHCRYELSEKLRQWLVPAAEAQKILESLESRKFFDDSRFAEIYARHKALYGKWGKRKIAMGLRLKRISANNITAALEAIDENQYRAAMIEALTAKARTIKEGDTFEGRTKLYRFGASRGYEPSLVAAALRAKILWPDSTSQL